MNPRRGSSPEERHRIEALFDAALDQPAETRASWLRDACGGDERIRREVEALLRAHEVGERIDGRLRLRVSGIEELAGEVGAEGSGGGPGAEPSEGPLAPVESESGTPGSSRGEHGAPGGDSRNAAPGPGRSAGPGAPAGAPAERRIGPYRVIRELGRGGMGVVYLAERDDGQFRRRVAVKLLRASPDADDLHQRFLAERQILASLEHPNIAHLLDGGVTDGQLPYLVMEYVDGLPITVWCDRHRLNVRERLRLFQSVCMAVHHAHSNLIIHRDLKPGNILVTAEGRVKLLDFGIAKLLNPGLGPRRAPVTRTEFRVLTPEYASPEQVRGETLTTTSDVYALGVILYELMAGCPPYRLDSKAPVELARVIEEREPPAPSAQWSAGREGRDAPPRSAAEIAASRDTSVEGLRRTLRGDVDAIVLKSLRKEPGRRYGSADLLATDIARWLDGHTVLARRGSGWYRLSKLARRHRRTSIAAALVLLAFVIGGAAALGQARVATLERERAEEARRVAERALRESEQVEAFLMSLFEAGNPLESGREGVTARDLLRRGSARADQLDDQPLIQAQMFEVIGLAERGLGEYGASRSSLERALALRRSELGETHLEVTRTLFHLTEVLRNGGHYAEATRMARAGLAAREANPEPGWPDVPSHLMQLSGMVIYSGEIRAAETLAERALEMRVERLGLADTAVATSLEFIAAVKRRRGADAEAESYLARAVRTRESAASVDGRALGTALLRLGDVLAIRGRAAEAETAYRRALPILRGALGATHPAVLDGESTYANFRADQGELREAEAALRRVAALRAEIYGENHPAAIGALGSVARILMLQGELAEAEVLLRRSLDTRVEQLGAEHGSVAGELVVLARVLNLGGRHAAADSAMAEAIRIRSPLGRPLMGLTLTQHAELLLERGELARADTLFIEGTALMREEIDPRHHDLRRVHGAMARLYDAQGRPADAERYRQLAALP